MKIATLQFNPTLGDMQNNATLILEKTKEAYAAGARVILTPELALCGFPPADLLLRQSFMQACDAVVTSIIKELEELSGLYLLLGHPVALQQQRPSDPLQRYNAISIIHEGKIDQIYAKQILADAQTAANSRYFVAGNQPVVFEVEGTKFGVLIGDDIAMEAGREQPARKTVEAGAEILLLPVAFPFYFNGQEELEESVSRVAEQLQTPIVVAQMTGGQDELVFAGASFAVDSRGDLQARAKHFEEDLFYLDSATHGPKPMGEIHSPVLGTIDPLHSKEESLWRALVTGVKDYMGKNGFSSAVLGLSGGMDSALVLAIAVDAIGAKNVSTVMMPSEYTADISLHDAAEMAKRMNVKHDVIEIKKAYSTLYELLSPVFSQLPPSSAEDTTEENLQARVRGTLLMGISNKTGALVLASGNKSELATGYCTLYGDMVGGYAVIKDLPKTKVYALAKWRNQNNPFITCENPIPERIIIRPPSAELKPDQTDQDNLPPYEVLDAILALYMEENQSIAQIVQQGFKQEDVDKVTRLIQISEYKRRQAPIGVKLTRRSFGADWRYPITSKFRA